jgi:molybdate transport system substrate-binding protein
MRAFLPLLLILALPLHAEEIVVSAAASTREALTEIAHAYESKTHDRVLLNFGGSNEMARQIVAGAKVNVFLAADERTMKRVGLTGRALLSNQLAVVSDKPIRSVFELKHLRRIAIANWNADVPAGVYAVAYLSSMKQWREVEPHAVPTVDVRAALAAFDSGAVDAAIVYRTDVRLAKRPHATLELERTNIVYPAAIIRSTPASKRFYAYLFSAEARRVFDKYGFLTPAPTKR